MRFYWKHCSGDRGTHFGVKGVGIFTFAFLNRFNAPICFFPLARLFALESLFCLIAPARGRQVFFSSNFPPHFVLNARSQLGLTPPRLVQNGTVFTEQTLAMRDLMPGEAPVMLAESPSHEHEQRSGAVGFSGPTGGRIEA